MSIQTVQVEHFKTSDGKIFAKESEAVDHQNMLDTVSMFMEQNRSDEPRGWAQRGCGWESTKCDDNDIRDYLISFFQTAPDVYYEVSGKRLMWKALKG